MSEGKHSYVRFFPSDWIAGTARMGIIHRAVYFEICCYIWDHARACPEHELPLMFADLPDWENVVELLIRAGKLSRTDEGLINDRAMAEANRAFDTWQRKSSGGRKGMQARWKDDGKPEPDNTPDKTLSKSDGGELIQNQNQNQNQNQSNTPQTPRSGGAYSGDFEQFWSEYPRRAGKGAAFRVWKKLPAADRKAIFGDLPVRSRTHDPWLRDGGKYIPNPSTYLNQRRWEDDIVQDGNQAKSSQGVAGWI